MSSASWAFRFDGPLIRRSTWSGAFVDLRRALRMLRKSPLYAAGVIGTLGLGLAAAVLVFTVAWRVWLAPMPYPDPDRVIRLYEVEPQEPSRGRSKTASSDRGRRRLSAPLLEDFRANSWRTIEAASAVASGVSERGSEGQTQRITKFLVSPEFFEILGILPALGRLPDTAANAEVLITERFWRRNLSADPHAVGSAQMRLDGQTHLVVGVVQLPSGYRGETDILIVNEWDDVAQDAELRNLRFLEAIARVRPGHTVEEARAEVNAFVAALAQTYPQHRGWGADVVVLADDLIRPFRGAIALLLVAGTVFLLLAGVNVMGLVAARRVESRQDRAIRLALGASELRLLRGSVVESVVLAGIGSIGGVLTAYWLIGPIRTLVPQDVPRLAEASSTPAIVLTALSIGVVLGAVIGLAGYLVSKGTRPSVGRAPVWRAAGAGGRRALVAGQVALTTLLAAGSTALLHHASTLRAIDLGFEAEGVSAATTVLSSGRYPSTGVRWQAWSTALDGLGVRGVRAAVALNTPMGPHRHEVAPFSVRPDDASEDVFFVLQPVSAEHFSVMGIDVLAGRVFGRTDDISPTDVVVVSEDFVDRYFPAGTRPTDVIGRVIGPTDWARSATSVGVVGATRHDGPDAPVMPSVYVPFSRLNFAGGTLLVEGEPEEVAEVVSAVVTQVDPDLHWTPLIPYKSHLEEWFAPLRLQLIIVGMLGGLGLLLASLGLYSVMAYHVATRRQEIGIRKAVGATDGRVMYTVLTNGLATAVVGALIGLAAWYRLLPLTRNSVDGIESASSVVPVAVAIVIGGSSVLATLGPAIRAVRVDPMTTLKAD